MPVEPAARPETLQGHHRWLTTLDRRTTSLEGRAAQHDSASQHIVDLLHANGRMLDANNDRLAHLDKTVLHLSETARDMTCVVTTISADLASARAQHVRDVTKLAAERADADAAILAAIRADRRAWPRMLVGGLLALFAAAVGLAGMLAAALHAPFAAWLARIVAAAVPGP